MNTPYLKSWVLNRQIWVGDSKYGVIGDPLFTGHVTQPNFGPKSPQKVLTRSISRVNIPYSKYIFVSWMLNSQIDPPLPTVGRIILRL